MENKFKSLSKKLFSQLKKDEILTVSFVGENSQSIRLNNAKVRQTGLVDDADIKLKMIANNRNCSGVSPSLVMMVLTYREVPQRLKE